MSPSLPALPVAQPATRDRRERAASRSSGRGGRAPTRASPGGRARRARRPSRARPSRGGTSAARGGLALPWKRFQLRTRSATGRTTLGGTVKVVIADPPAYTPPYDRALAAALARAGADVELAHVSLPLRAGRGARRLRRARRSSIRCRRGSATARLRLVAEGRSSTRLGSPGSGSRGRTSCTCSGSAHPRSTPGCSGRVRRSSSRRTTFCRAERATARRCGGGCSAASTGSSCTARTAGARSTAFGVPADKLRVIPHPVFPGTVEHRDDGRTVLALGVDPAVQGSRGRDRRGSPRRRRPAPRRRGRPRAARRLPR